LRSLVTLFSPSGFGAGLADEPKGQPPAAEPGHILSRMRRSLGLGGVERVNSVIWPLDLPQPFLPGKVVGLPPILPPGFLPAREGQVGGNRIRQTADRDSIELQQLAEDYILYHGPGGRLQLELLAAAWHWAAPAIGEYYPLLLTGLSGEDQQIVSRLRERHAFGDSLQVLPGVVPAQLPHLYQRSTAVFHPAPASPWCGPVRFALASGKPLVAVENVFTSAITGPAAYLAGGKDARALGAALVTVVVEEQVASGLSAAAEEKVRGWDHQNYGEQLLALYRTAGKNFN
jgi:glycosyltransferase involved in cell wall biosynthesis